MKNVEKKVLLITSLFLTFSLSSCDLSNIFDNIGGSKNSEKEDEKENKEEKIADDLVEIASELIMEQYFSHSIIDDEMQLPKSIEVEYKGEYYIVDVDYSIESYGDLSFSAVGIFAGSDYDTLVIDNYYIDRTINNQFELKYTTHYKDLCDYSNIVSLTIPLIEQQQVNVAEIALNYVMDNYVNDPYITSTVYLSNGEYTLIDGVEYYYDLKWELFSLYNGEGLIINNDHTYPMIFLTKPIEEFENDEYFILRCEITDEFGNTAVDEREIIVPSFKVSTFEEYIEACETDDEECVTIKGKIVRSVDDIDAREFASLYLKDEFGYGYYVHLPEPIDINYVEEVGRTFIVQGIPEVYKGNYRMKEGAKLYELGEYSAGSESKNINYEYKKHALYGNDIYKNVLNSFVNIKEAYISKIENGKYYYKVFGSEQEHRLVLKDYFDYVEKNYDVNYEIKVGDCFYLEGIFTCKDNQYTLYATNLTLVEHLYPQDLYIVGDFTNWELNDDYKFNYVPSNRYEKTIYVEEGQVFSFVNSNFDALSYSYKSRYDTDCFEIVYSNFICNVSGFYDFIYNEIDSQLIINKTLDYDYSLIATDCSVDDYTRIGEYLDRGVFTFNGNLSSPFLIYTNLCSEDYDGYHYEKVFYLQNTSIDKFLFITVNADRPMIVTVIGECYENYQYVELALYNEDKAILNYYHCPYNIIDEYVFEITEPGTYYISPILNCIRIYSLNVTYI